MWLGEEAAEPEWAPLEVVVGHVDDDSCVLNRNEVGAGSHDVSVIAESGPATVRIVTGSGDVVFERAALPASDSSSEDGALEVPAGEDGGEAVRLDTGDYLIECATAGGVSSAKLHVVPARPGFDSIGIRDARSLLSDKTLAAVDRA